MQLHFCPDAARIERDFDAIEHFPRAALTPKIVVRRMRSHHGRQISFLFTCRTAGRKAIDETILIPPIAGEKVAWDAAMIGAGTIEVRQAVMCSNACQRRRRECGHKPLQHAKIGLADAADFAGAPRLPTNPFDDVVEVLLVPAAEKFECTGGTAAAPHVHVNVSVALLDVPLDRTGLAPEELRARR